MLVGEAAVVVVAVVEEGMDSSREEEEDMDSSREEEGMDSKLPMGNPRLRRSMVKLKLRTSNRRMGSSRANMRRNRHMGSRANTHRRLKTRTSSHSKLKCNSSLSSMVL